MQHTIFLALCVLTLPTTVQCIERYVNALTGADESDCSNPIDPCQTVLHVTNNSLDGDVILVEPNMVYPVPDMVFVQPFSSLEFRTTSQDKAIFESSGTDGIFLVQPNDNKRDIFRRIHFRNGVAQLSIGGCVIAPGQPPPSTFTNAHLEFEDCIFENCRAVPFMGFPSFAGCKWPSLEIVDLNLHLFRPRCRARWLYRFDDHKFSVYWMQCRFWCVPDAFVSLCGLTIQRGSTRYGGWCAD